MKTTSMRNASGNRTKFQEIRANGKRKHETQTIVK